jgi:hypothetical protein
MLKLRKLPLEPLIQILQDLYDSGADYIDISGEQSKEGTDLKDIIQITIKPEYMNVSDDDDDIDVENIEIDYSEDDVPDTTTRTLSDDDINNLIE